MTLQISHVTKRYGATTALDDVSMSISPGRILGLCGENGAGKSTLMAVLAGVIPSGEYEGSVSLDGSPMQLTGPHAAIDQGIALLPQELVFLPDRSVADNILVGRWPASLGVVNQKARDARTRELLRVVALPIEPWVPLRRLETSERQLVCIARALSADPRVLILDEPSAAIQRSAAERLHAVLRGLASEGRTIIYISHHLSDVSGLVDEVCVLRNGRVVMPPTAGASVDDIVVAMVGAVVSRAERSARALPPAEVFAGSIRRAERNGRVELDEVHITARRGEIVGIAGLTGSGAAAILPLFAGARAGRADVRIELNGVRINASSPVAVARAGIAFVPADRRSEGLIAIASVARNILLGRERLTSRFGIRRPAAERIRTLAGIERFAIQPADPVRPIRQLSGGNQQKVLMARAALQEPEVVLLAEPTRGVDVRARAAIHDRIRVDAESGRTFIVTSSDVAELAVLCDRVVAVAKGRVVREIDAANWRGGIPEDEILSAIN